MFTEKFAIGRILLNATLRLLGVLLQLHGSQFFYYCPDFPRRFSLLNMDKFDPSCYQLHLGTMCYRKYGTVEANGTTLIFDTGEYFFHSFQHAKALVSNCLPHTVDKITTASVSLLKLFSSSTAYIFDMSGAPLSCRNHCTAKQKKKRTTQAACC